MTEQVDTNIIGKIFYDTSILQYGNCIYYFKRIYDQVEDSMDGSKKGGTLSSREQESYEDGDDSDSFTNSYLQLFKYDLEKFQESLVDGYQLVEYNQDDRTFNVMFSQNFDNDNLIQQ